MGLTDSDNVASVQSNSAAPFTTNPILNKLKRAFNAFPGTKGTAAGAGSSSDPNDDPSVDPSRVVAENNPFSSSGPEAHPTDPNDPGKGAAEMFGRPYGLSIGKPPYAVDPNPDMTGPGEAMFDRAMSRPFQLSNGLGQPKPDQSLTGASADGAANSSVGGSTAPVRRQTHGQNGAPAAPATLAGAGKLQDARTQAQIGAQNSQVPLEPATPSSVFQGLNTSASTPKAGDEDPMAALASGAAGDARTPVLAHQGPKNPILNFLTRMIGLNGDQPKPGQPYSPVSKLTAIPKLIANLGNSLAQFGSPKEAELAEQRAEFYPKLEMEEKVLQNNMDYRRAMVGARYANMENQKDIANIRTQPQEQRNEIAAHKQAMVLDPAAPGGFRSMQPDEIMKDPYWSTQLPIMQAASTLKTAQAAAANARAAALTDPNNPVLKERVRHDEAVEALAGKRMGMEFQKMGATGWMDEFATGLNPINGHTLQGDNAAGALPAGIPLDQNGNPVPQRSAQYSLPPERTRSAAYQAKAIGDAGTMLTQTLNRDRDILGPIHGTAQLIDTIFRNPDPRFTEDRAALESYVSLQPGAHGMRSEEMVREWAKILPANLNVDALIAGIKGNTWILGGSIGKEGTVRTTPGQGGGAPAAPTSPKFKTPVHKAVAAKSGGAPNAGGSDHLNNLLQKYNLKPVGQ